MTSQQGFLFFHLAMLKHARKLMDFFKKRKLNEITLEKNPKIFEFSVEKINKFVSQKMLITLKRIIASFIFLVLQSIRPTNPKLFGVNTWFIFWGKKKEKSTLNSFYIVKLEI